MKTLLFSALFSLLTISTAHAAEQLNIINPWIPESPPGARVMAGYMEIHNSGKQAIDIVSVKSPMFNSVEMHLSKEVDGTAKMLPQQKLIIPANDRLILEPGSYHLMLMKPVKRLKSGDKVELVFELSNGNSQPVSAIVKKNTAKKNRSMKCAAGKCGGGKCGGGN